MKPNAECTHGQYSFLFEHFQTYKTAVTGSTAVRRDCVKQPIDSKLRPGSTFAGVAAEDADETNILR
jgi:hypothetical protein